MTRRRKTATAMLALGLSGVLHAAALFQIDPSNDIALEGGEARAVPELGDSFADMAQGAAVPVSQSAEALPPAAVPAAAQTPQPAAAPRPDAIAALPPETPTPLPDPDLAAIAPATPAQTAPRTPAEALGPVPDTVAKAAPIPSAKRPQSRPDRPAPQQAQRSPAPQTQTNAPAQPAGNADRNATRGANTGQHDAASAAARSQRPAAQGDGGAAATASYGRAVLTKISRTRKQRAPSRGRTVVAFTISPAGALASVQVVQSSGSAALDQVALDHIRRSAPFPAPPAGAQRQFSFEFVGRS